MKTFVTVVFVISCAAAFGQKVKKADNPIANVERVFKDYIKYTESTDSKDDKEAMTNALKALQLVSKAKDLPLLLNVWMYYDPTDFPTGELIEPIFMQNKLAAIAAIDRRLKARKKWEKAENSPYSDLVLLKQRLSK